MSDVSIPSDKTAIAAMSMELGDALQKEIVAFCDKNELDFSTRTTLVALVAARMVANHVASDSISSNMLSEPDREAALERHLKAFDGVTRHMAKQQFQIMSARVSSSEMTGPKH